MMSEFCASDGQQLELLATRRRFTHVALSNTAADCVPGGRCHSRFSLLRREDVGKELAGPRIWQPLPFSSSFTSGRQFGVNISWICNSSGKSSFTMCFSLSPVFIQTSGWSQTVAPRNVLKLIIWNDLVQVMVPFKRMFCSRRDTQFCLLDRSNNRIMEGVETGGSFIKYYPPLSLQCSWLAGIWTSKSCSSILLTSNRQSFQSVQTFSGLNHQSVSFQDKQICSETPQKKTGRRMLITALNGSWLAQMLLSELGGICTKKKKRRALRDFLGALHRNKCVSPHTNRNLC